jgi:aspartyl-tRNA(Asn)/glutamyl-tRNA(Gln) amidotransferase subunit C
VTVIDEKTVKRIAHLARIGVSPNEVTQLQKDMSVIFSFLDTLKEVDISMIHDFESTNAHPITLLDPPPSPRAEDIKKILANAPMAEDDFFVIPKVVE